MSAAISLAQQVHQPVGRQLRQQCRQQQRQVGGAPHRRGPWAPAVSAVSAAAAAAPPAAPAAAAAPLGPPQLQAVDLLERSCASSSIGQDRLSEQQQEYFVNCGAAVRALQKVGRGGEPGWRVQCATAWAWAWTKRPRCTARPLHCFLLPLAHPPASPAAAAAPHRRTCLPCWSASPAWRSFVRGWSLRTG